MKVRLILIVTSTLMCLTALYSQDNTFELEEAFRLDPGENSLFNRLVLADMNENGIDEIITSVCPAPISVNHRLTIIENREIIFQGEQFNGVCRPPFIVDYNRDGVNDIAYENIQAAEDGRRFFLIYYGPDYEREVWGAGYFGTDDLNWGGSRLHEDGTTSPFFTHDEVANFHHFERGEPFLSIDWKVDRMTEGIHEDEDGPQFVVDICRSSNFTVKKIDNRTVYFASGHNDFRRDEDFQDLIRLVYFQMFTNYNSEFESPDSLTLFHRVDLSIYSDTSNICHHSLISDLDNDGTLEWIQPWWHQTPVDTFQIHLPIVDAETMEISATFTEQITDIEFEWSPRPITGIEAVDINGDGRMEILLVLQNHPIQIIDSETLEIILESEDFVFPNSISYFCDIGHFDDSGRLQLIFRDEETYEFVIYNLPEGWQGEPVEFADYTINLVNRWNLVSSPFIPQDDDIETIFATLSEHDNLFLVKDYSGRFYSPEQNFNNIPRWDVNQGYQIKMNQADRLWFTGEEVASDRPIPLPENWSMVAYFPGEPVEVQTALANIADQLLIAKDGVGHFYAPQFDFNNIPPLHRGSGYQVKVSEEVELVWNVDGEEVAMNPVTQPHQRLLHFVRKDRTGSNMSVLVTNLPEAGEIGAFTPSGLCVGAAAFSNQDKVGLAVWGDDPTTVVVDGAVEGEDLSFRLWNGENEYSTDIEVETGKSVWESDGLLTGSLKILKTLPVEFEIQAAYPNPFNSSTKVTYSIPHQGILSLNLYDLHGRSVNHENVSISAVGRYSKVLDLSDYPTGVYFLRMEFGFVVRNQKLVLIR